MDYEQKPNASSKKQDEAQDSLNELQRIMKDAGIKADAVPKENAAAPTAPEKPTEQKPQTKPAPAKLEPIEEKPTEEKLTEEKLTESTPEEPVKPAVTEPTEKPKTELLPEEDVVLAVEKAAARERANRRAAEVAAEKQQEAAQSTEQKQTKPHKEPEKAPVPESKKPAASTETPKKKPQSRKAAAAARRRKRRMYRLGLVVVVLLLLVVLVVSGVRAVMGRVKTAEAAKTDTVQTTEGSAAEEPVDTRPASEQECEQYLAIKDDTTLPAYALKYAGMYSDWVSIPNKKSTEKVCYITFDDGPAAATTPEILDTLKEYDVKATFFVVGSELEENKALLQRIIDEGHTLGIHANVHEYGTVYESVDNYLEDFSTIYNKIYELTGYRAECFRFIGGSNNGVLKSNGTYDEIVTEMTRRGFEYYDWNAYDHDSEGGNYTTAELADYAVNEVEKSSRDDVILLMHDIKKGAMEALPTILERLQNDGITFKALDAKSRPVHFEVDESTPPEFTETTEDSSDSDSSKSSSSKSDSSKTDSNKTDSSKSDSSTSAKKTAA